MKTILADLHNHLRMDHGLGRGRAAFNQAIDAAAKRLGKGGVFSLANYGDRRYEDFSELPGYERLQFDNAIYVPEKEIWVVKGEEIETKQGHILALGVDKEKRIAFGRDLLDTVREAKRLGALAGIDHPFHLDGAGTYLADNLEGHIVLGEVNFWETHNGEAALWLPGLTKIGANQRASRVFSELRQQYPHLAKSVASDGHSIYELGSSYMEMPEISGKSRGEIVSSLYQAMLAATHWGMPERKHPSYFGALEHCMHMAWHILRGRAKLKSSEK